jgi:hypothetical protein
MIGNAKPVVDPLGDKALNDVIGDLTVLTIPDVSHTEFALAVFDVLIRSSPTCRLVLLNVLQASTAT